MSYERFSTQLNILIEDSGLSRTAIKDEVQRLYGSSVRLTDSDFSTYLGGERLPRMDKFAALMDVLGATHAEIARLIRCVPRTTQKDVPATD